MRKFLLVTSILVASVSYTFAQMWLMDAVNNKVKALKEDGVDTIITYHPYCDGCILTGISTSDTCFHNISEYVIWKQKGESYVQFFDECYSYLPKKGASGLIALISSNTTDILNETLLPIEVEKIINGKLEKRTYIRHHTDHQNFVFHVNGSVTEKAIDKHILNTQWEDDFFLKPGDTKFSLPPGKILNINYDKNQKTYLKKLADLAEMEVEKEKFERVR